MFGRKRPPVEEAVAQEATDRTDPTAPKGRPTPSRKEAEAARKQGLKVPKDPKEARRAERERARAERERSRAGMLAGDERYLPARDQGPARAFARDFVDSRFTVAEYFIFVAIAVLALGFIRQPVVQSWVSLFFFAFTALIVVDTLVLLIMLNRRARQQFPEKSDRRGLSMYAMLRTIQLRRLRLPRPRVRRGGAPIVPKAPKP
jgi:hypothetical protein